MYFSFYCDNSTAKLSFEAPTGNYNVTNINPTTKTFVIQIQAKKEDSCNARNGVVPQLNQSLDSSPFDLNKVNPRCGAEAENSSVILSEAIMEIEIAWQPPREPICNSSRDCKDWTFSTCSVTNGITRCLCNANFTGDRSALNCTPGEDLTILI